jgi:hypothetical protein
VRHIGWRSGLFLLLLLLVLLPFLLLFLLSLSLFFIRALFFRRIAKGKEEEEVAISVARCKYNKWSWINAKSLQREICFHV